MPEQNNRTKKTLSPFYINSLPGLFIIFLIVVVCVMYTSGCKKNPGKTILPQPECGVAWVGSPLPGYIDLAVDSNLRLAPIFEFNGTQTTDITNWISFIKTAQQRGVKMRICPIPVSDSAYMDDRHAAVQVGIVWNFVQIMQAAGVKPCEIILDIEGINATKYCTALISFMLGSVSARDTLVANALSITQRDSAIAVYRNFVNQCHLAGWTVGATTLNQIAVEPVGDISIERVLGIPITGVNWDFVTYQAYRTSTFSTFTSLGFSPPTSWFVYRFGKLAQTHYGASAGLDIGIMGVNSSWGYSTFADWQSDVSATRAAGINPDLVAGFRMETANTPVPGDSALFFSLLESSPAPAIPPQDPSTEDYIMLYDSADARIGPLLPQ